MQAGRFYTVTLVFLLGVLGWLTYGIYSPFFVPIAWAIVFSIIFYPLYGFILRRVRLETAASLLTTLIICLTVLGPFAYVTVMFINEVGEAASGLSREGLAGIRSLLARAASFPAVSRIVSLWGGGDIFTAEAFSSNAAKIGKALIDMFSVRITNLFSAAADFLFMLFTTFFLLRDGPGFLEKMSLYLPFSSGQKERLTRQVKDMIVSTVYGGVTIALIQGLLGGIAFSVIGLQAPVMWGVTMSVMSFVPLVGTFAVWGPASAYLMAGGEMVKGMGLLLYGVFVISMVDNILKPLIIGTRTKLPAIMVLFSVLGGIKLFGMIGLIMGPLISVVFVSVLEIFRNIEQTEP